MISSVSQCQAFLLFRENQAWEDGISNIALFLHSFLSNKSCVTQYLFERERRTRTWMDNMRKCMGGMSRGGNDAWEHCIV